YREEKSGGNAAAGGAANSNHSRGYAVDVNPNGGGSSYQTLWTFASQNPQFGVCFPFQDKPFTGYAHGDPPHMILAGIGGVEGARCDAQGVTKPCNGVPFNPKSGGASGG